MARIKLTTFTRLDKDRNSIHVPVTATYSVFEENGEKFVQIDTYGRSDRAIPEKISQSLQFDRDTAKYLVNLFIKEFDMTF